ncbi:MAG: hypothetical protein R2739_02065 [Chitinophagales bacterium]
MLDKNEIRYIQNIIQGNAIEGQEDLATTIRNYLCTSFTASKVAERKFEYYQRIKKEQEKILIQLSENKNLWYSNTKLHFLTEGGEAKVYFEDKGKYVVKYNDAIYYNTWLDFLNSILLHNIFFPNTQYTLLGFDIKDDILFAVLKQPYISTNQITVLTYVTQTLESYGFTHLKRFDYIHSEYKIIMEDLHDENVLTIDENLFFIDTVILLQ